MNGIATEMFHTLMWYADRETGERTMRFPDNPNGSEGAIAGLMNNTGTIIGHMAHTEAGIHPSRHPEYFRIMDRWRREGVPLNQINQKTLEGTCMKIFENIVKRVG